MVKVKDDCMDDMDGEEQKEWREKVPVLLRRHEHTQKKEISVEDGKDKKLKGTWHAGWPLEDGKRMGRILTWKHSNIGNGCRDYRIRMVVSEDGQTAYMRYRVEDRCREPATYVGTAQLTRKAGRSIGS